MDLKFYLKHSFLLYAFILIFGFVLYASNSIFGFLIWPDTYILPLTLIVCVIIPFLYSVFFLRKKSIRDLAIFIVLFLVISMSISISSHKLLLYFADNAKEWGTTYDISVSVSGTAPVYAVGTAIYLLAPNLDKILFTGSPIDLVIGFLLTYAILFPTIFAGQFFSKFVRNKI